MAPDSASSSPNCSARLLTACVTPSTVIRWLYVNQWFCIDTDTNRDVKWSSNFQPGLSSGPRWRAHGAPQTHSQVGRGYPPHIPPLSALKIWWGQTFVCRIALIRQLVTKIRGVKLKSKFQTLVLKFEFEFDLHTFSIRILEFVLYFHLVKIGNSYNK